MTRDHHHRRGAAGSAARPSRCCAPAARRSSAWTWRARTSSATCAIRPRWIAAVAAAIEQLGGLDVLINNAGLGTPQSAAAPPDEAALAVLDVNLVGPWRVTSRRTARAARVPRARGERGERPRARDRPVLHRVHAVQARRRRLQRPAAAGGGRPRSTVTTVYPGYIRTAIHKESTAAGVPLEGAVPVEDVSDAARTLVRAALGAPPATSPPRARARSATPSCGSRRAASSTRSRAARCAASPARATSPTPVWRRVRSANLALADGCGSLSARLRDRAAPSEASCLDALRGNQPTPRRTAPAGATSPIRRRFRAARHREIYVGETSRAQAVRPPRTSRQHHRGVRRRALLDGRLPDLDRSPRCPGPTG